MKTFFITALAVFVLVANLKTLSQDMNNINIIPKPKSIVLNEGTFKLTAETKIYFDQYSKKVADYLAEVINPATGFNFKPVIWNGLIETNSIILSLKPKSNEYGKEGYTLVINPFNVLIEANELNGLFYGVQTLRQLFDPYINSVAKV